MLGHSEKKVENFFKVQAALGEKALERLTSLKKAVVSVRGALEEATFPFAAPWLQLDG